MEEPIVIELFKKLLKPLIKLLGYMLCIPQLLLKGLKLKILGNYRCNKIFEILYTLLFLFFYNCIYLNFHIIFLLKNFSLIESKFELFIAFIIFYSFSASFYYTEDIRYFILKDISFFLILIFSVFQYLMVALCFCVRLDFQSLEIIFANKYNIGITFQDNWAIVNLFFHFWETMGIVICNILIVLHAVNPLSLFRLPYIIKHRSFVQQPNRIVSSAFMIIVDFLLIMLHLLNVPFVFSFLRNTFSIIDSIFMPLNSLNIVNSAAADYDATAFQRSVSENYFSDNEYRKYNRNANLIFNAFINNYGMIFSFVHKKIMIALDFVQIIFNYLFNSVKIIYNYMINYVKIIYNLLLNFAEKLKQFAILIFKHLVVFAFSAVNLLVFWRIKQLMNYLMVFKQEHDLGAFIQSSLELNFIGLSDLLFLVAFILNRIIVINYFFLNLYEQNIADFTKRNFSDSDGYQTSNTSYSNIINNKII